MTKENVTIDEALTQEETATVERISEKILCNDKIRFESCTTDRPFLVVLEESASMGGAGFFMALREEGLQTVGVTHFSHQTNIHVEGGEA
jgi:hypothetical protein